MTSGRAITCHSCGGAIAVKAAGYSVTIACQYCGSLLDVANPDVQLITEYHQAAGSSALPLGVRGTIFGIEWEVIGYLERSDGDAAWTEYLLFNPYGGYRWLVLSDGEWQFGTMLLDMPDRKGSEAVRWNGATYNQDYAALTTTTDRVVGEFYWRVRAGEQVQGCTYSDDDDGMLSLERSDGEVNWTLLESISDADVRAAFGLPAPKRSSFASLGGDFHKAKSMRGSDLPFMFLMAFVSALIIFIIMAVFGMSTASFEGRSSVRGNGPERNVTLGTISTGRPYQFVTVRVRSSTFDNRWIDLDYSLVDRKSQQSFDASSVVEHYTGRDSDGPWSEGSYETRTLFGNVPQGGYDIVVDMSSHRWSDGSGVDSVLADEEVFLWFDATVGGFSWGNYWLLCCLLFAGPMLILFWRRQ